MKRVMDFLTTHSRLGSQFAEEIGLDEVAVQAFRDGYEQWDGKGVPRGLRGTEIRPPGPAGAARRPGRGLRAGGTAGRRPGRPLGRHRGADFDPAVVDAFCAHDADVLDDLDRGIGVGRARRRRAAV